jgi:hypothetical protein
MDWYLIPYLIAVSSLAHEGLCHINMDTAGAEADGFSHTYFVAEPLVEHKRAYQPRQLRVLDIVEQDSTLKARPWSSYLRDAIGAWTPISVVDPETDIRIRMVVEFATGNRTSGLLGLAVYQMVVRLG